MKLASSTNQLISKILAFPWLPELLAGLAGVLYLAQSLDFAFTQWSVVDEGNYAYKGWLFATGRYTPYQDYGPWTNHMPLSFLISGAAQLLFGPGLRTIRYFAVFLGCLFLLAMWLSSRRLAGRWAAAACLWFIALNPFPISDYSVGVAEGPVACILAWTLYFTLGEGRSTRELIAGSILAAVLVLTRENMGLILPFLVFYIFWEHGKKAGFLFTAIMAGIFLAVHALYWPGIVRIWATWAPKFVRASLGEWVYQGTGIRDEPPQSSLVKNLLVIFSSVRVNFLTIFGPLAVWLAWPKDGFKDRAQFRQIVFLSVAFVVLYAAHAWASLTTNFCTFCLINYVTFFSPVGLLLFFAFLPGLRERRPLFPAWLAGCVILLLVAGIAYSNYEKLGGMLAAIRVPRIPNLGETVELWQVLANKFGLDFQDLRRLMPPVAGFLAGILILGTGYALTKLRNNDQFFSRPLYALLSMALITGLVLSPTPLLGALNESGRCDQDVVAQYESIGAQLAPHVPPGTRVYWRGDSSPAPLLYLPGIEIYPPQLNGFFSFRTHKDVEGVLRYGFWNKAIDAKWRAEADLVLIRESELPSLQTFLSRQRFEQVGATSPVFLCAPDTKILVFKRK